MTDSQFMQMYQSLPEALQKEAERFVTTLVQKATPPIKSKSKNTEESRGGYGCLKGKLWVSEDFDAPLEDFKELVVT